MLKHGGNEIVNIYIGLYVRKSICQNKNLVRVVKKVIGNIATQLPKIGSFCLTKHYRTTCVNSIHAQSKRSWGNCFQNNMCNLDQNEAPSYTFSIISSASTIVISH